MANSKRFLAIEAVATALRRMTADKGFAITPKKVFIGRRRFSDSEKTPFIAVVEKPQQPGAERDVRGSNEFVEVTYGIFGYIDGDTDDDPVSPAYGFLAEIKKCLQSYEPNKLGDPVEVFETTPGYVWQDDKTGATYCHLEANVRICENLADPYDT